MLDISISPHTTIIEALKKLDKVATKVLLVVDENKKLLGTVTDGDIRRYILKTGKIEGTIEEVYFKDCFFVYEHEIDKIKELMVLHSLELIPIVNSEKIVVSYKTWTDVFSDISSKKKIKKDLKIPVVIMAGGKGIRLDPFTQVLPKPLIPVGNKTMIEKVIDSFREYRIEEFYITVNYKGEMIIAYFNGIEKDYRIHFIREEEFLGTAGSLYYLKDIIKTDFIVSNCDIILKVDYSDVYNFHKQNQSRITILTSIQHHKVPYGVVEIKSGGMVSNIEEKPEYTFQINTGVYVFNKSVLDLFKEKRYIDMPEIVNHQINIGNYVCAYPVNESDYIDIGQWQEYRENLKKIEGIENR